MAMLNHRNFNLFYPKFIHSLVKYPLKYSKGRQILGFLIRNRSFQLIPYLKASSFQLNLGCGNQSKEGFINMDYNWSPGVNICWDLSRGIPFDSNSIQGVFSEHCLEHLPFETVSFILKDILRVLKPGGCLRLVLPNAELYCDLYQRSKKGEAVHFPYQQYEVSEKNVTPTPPLTPMMRLNSVFRDHGHQFAYDFETVEKILGEQGYKSITRCQFNEGRNAQLLIDEPWRKVESLYVEATK